ncbi:MAG: hypothetical protein NWE95_01950 [Candidatus Bathyarchaeota archaeon]|nr:hypothetical protein [Candidatus Bathyarchaeota archaeon]
MVDLETVLSIVNQLGLPKKPDTLKIFIVNESCPHCNEFVDSSQFKDFVKSNDFTAISFEGYTFCGDCKDSYITNRIFRIDTPTLVDIADLEVEPVPQKYIEWLKHYQDVGLKVPKRATRRKTESEGTSKKRKRSKKSEELNEFVREKQEKKNIAKAANQCLEDICIEQ